MTILKFDDHPGRYQNPLKCFNPQYVGKVCAKLALSKYKVKFILGYKYLKIYDFRKG